MLAKEVTNPDQPGLGALDIRIRRNAYGRRSIAPSAPASSGESPLEMVFIPRPQD